MAKKSSQLNIAEELKEILKEYSEELYQNKEEALDEASDYLLERLENETPVNEGLLKKSWERTDKYKSVRYVGNSVLNSKNIPVINLLEFGSKGKPFVRKTFEKEKNKIIDIIKGGLNK